jgi:hypothetical protein
MAASAVRRSARLVLRLAVIALVVGVVALYHLAAHHGAADPDHPASPGVTTEAGHDAEPAAGVVDDLALHDDVAVLGAVAATTAAAPATGGDPEHPQQLSSAMLTALVLLAAATAVLLGGRPHRVHRARPARRRCTQRGRAPPPGGSSTPARLARLQVLVV